MESFLLTFIPLFVAIDPVSTIPLFLGLTDGVSKKEKQKLALQAVTTALIVGMVFGTAGQWIFKVLGITAADFRIAGGLLLLILSIREIFGPTARRVAAPAADRFIGIVPLGVPFIAGPAMLTTLLILQDEHSFSMITLALVANLLITLVLLNSAERFIKVAGEATSRVVAKVIAIFLAAIGIMMIRKGLETLLLLH